MFKNNNNNNYNDNDDDDDELKCTDFKSAQVKSYVAFFDGRGKPWYVEKNLSEYSTVPTNSTHT